MDLALLGTLLPVGCQTAEHADGQLEVYRDLQNGNRYSEMFDPKTADENDVAQTVFDALYAYKFPASADVDTPPFTPGATIDI